MSGFHWHPEVALGLEALLAGYLLATGVLRRRFGWGPPPARGRGRGVPRRHGDPGGRRARAPRRVGRARRALGAHGPASPADPGRAAPVAPGPAALAPGAGRAGARRRAARLVAHPAAPGARARLRGPGRLARPGRRSTPPSAWSGSTRSEHVTFLATGLLLWWPVAGPTPEWPRPSPPAQLLYLFLATIPMMAIAAPITLAEDVLYPFYAAAGRRVAARAPGGSGAGGSPHVGGRDVRLPGRGDRGVLPVGGARGPRGRRGARSPGRRRRRMAAEGRIVREGSRGGPDRRRRRGDPHPALRRRGRRAAPEPGDPRARRS